MSSEAEDTNLQRIARKFRWMARIVAPDAPGFVFFGGELCPADFGISGYQQTMSLSGKGLDAEEAFAGCVGEGVEHLSRLDWGDRQLSRGTPLTADHRLDPASLAEIVRLTGYEAERESPELDWPELDWMEASRLSDGASVRVPARLCIR